MGWLAEEESNKKSERIKAAIRTTNGVTCSYKGNKWGRKGLNQEQFDKIIELRANGYSMHNIAAELKISVGVVHKTISKVIEETLPEIPTSSIG